MYDRGFNPDDRITIDSLINLGIERLKKADVKDSRICAELTLCKLLNVSRHFILIEKNKIVDPQIAVQFREYMERRASRIPLQYILGETEFYGLPFKCDSRALIPRPESEILVEIVLKEMVKIEKPRILDIGTGSGNISISLAKNLPNARVEALDISVEALQLAQENAGINSVISQIEFIAGDFEDAEFMRSLGNFNCVVSNPPYVSLDEKNILEPEVQNYEPEDALYAGHDPLSSYKTIIPALPRLLLKNGFFAFEIGFGQRLGIIKLFNSEFYDIEISKDYSGIDRIISGFWQGGVN
jgi:release factor glutamine methyltransferase